MIVRCPLSLLHPSISATVALSFLLVALLSAMYAASTASSAVLPCAITVWATCSHVFCLALCRCQCSTLSIIATLSSPPGRVSASPRASSTIAAMLCTTQAFWFRLESTRRFSNFSTDTLNVSYILISPFAPVRKAVSCLPSSLALLSETPMLITATTHDRPSTPLLAIAKLSPDISDHIPDALSIVSSPRLLQSILSSATTSSHSSHLRRPSRVVSLHTACAMTPLLLRTPPFLSTRTISSVTSRRTATTAGS